jgi:soluble P-type ATPase
MIINKIKEKKEEEMKTSFIEELSKSITKIIFF